MSWLVLDKSKCKQDGVCVAVCPSSALGRDEQGGPVELAQKRCIQCGHCVAVCPTEAIALESLPQEPMLPAPREPIAPELFDAFATSLRSIREFKDEPVDRDAFAAMLDVARRASTAVNRQGLHWIAVSGKDKVHAIAEAVFAGLDASMRSPRAIELFESGHDFLLRNAPSLAVCCAPLASDWGWSDCGIATATLALAAQARGFGSCWAGFLIMAAQRHEPLRQILGVPQDMGVYGALMLGSPKYKYKRIPPRQPLSVSWL